jgi:hypothetical protein
MRDHPTVHGERPCMLKPLLLKPLEPSHLILEKQRSRTLSRMHTPRHHSHSRHATHAHRTRGAAHNVYSTRRVRAASHIIHMACDLLNNHSRDESLRHVGWHTRCTRPRAALVHRAPARSSLTRSNTTQQAMLTGTTHVRSDTRAKHTSRDGTSRGNQPQLIKLFMFDLK